MKASIKQIVPQGYLFARQNRRRLGRIKAWWRRHGCRGCSPWLIHSTHFAPPFPARRSTQLRLYALEWLRMLSPLDPRLRGPLADELEYDPWGDVDPDVFAACIEIDVACDAIALAELLARFGYRAERLDGGGLPVFMIEGALEPVEMTLRTSDDLPKGEFACDVATLERRVWELLPPSYRGWLG